MPTMVLNATRYGYYDTVNKVYTYGAVPKISEGYYDQSNNHKMRYVPFYEYNTEVIPTGISVYDSTQTLQLNVLTASNPFYMSMKNTSVTSTGIKTIEAGWFTRGSDVKIVADELVFNVGDMYGTFATNAPLTVNYVFQTPKAPTLPTSASNLNKYLINRLSWTNTSVQVSSMIEWSNNDFVTSKTIVGGANPYVDVPAGTFDLGTIKWKVKITDVNAMESAYSTVASFTCMEIPVVVPINLSPTGTQDKYKPINFNWDGGSVVGAKYELQYNNNNTGWQVLVQNLSNNNYTAPKNIFALGELNWKVRTTTPSTQVSEFSSVATITIAEFPPAKPFNLVPTGNIDKYKETLFTWNVEEGIIQSKFEFEYSQDNAQTWTKKTEYSTATSTKFPANSFALGALLWRVRITDSDGLVSEYSTNASCNVILYPPKKPINLTPSSGSINKDLENKFTWDLDGAQQSKFTLTYSQNNGASWTDITLNTNNNYYTLPANLLTLGTLLWKVKIADSNNVESEYSSQASVTVVETVIVKPTIPVNLIPSDTNINLADVVRFSWYATEAQKDFTLAYSEDGGLNYKTITGVTSNKYVDILANTFVKGTLLWKVKYTATRNVTSEYSSQATINVISKPVTPTINNIAIDGLGTNVDWTSTEQSSYQLQILKATVIILDTLEVSDPGKKYTTPLILENNISYTFRLRVKNAYGLWSDWSEKIFLAKFVAPSTPTFLILNLMDRLQINISNPITGEKVIYNNVYRSEDNIDFIRIATNVIDTYVDYKIRSEKVYYYKVQAISEFGNAYSEVIEASIKLSNAQIISTITNKLVNIKYNVKRDISYVQDISLLQFAGRKKPVSEYSEHDSQINISLDFKIINQEELNNLEDIFNSKETCLYRDNRGRKAYCTINSYSCKDDKGKTYNVNIAMSEVGYTEEV